MAASNRSAQYTNIYKVLAKHYTPVASNTERPVIEHLLFACCLEDARYELAEEALASIVEQFFDWNEVRVSSVRELSEVMARLPDPPAAGTRLKKSLQHIFEDGYTFDLEALRKKNLGPAQEDVAMIDGVSSFTVAYVVQTALGGHSIPIDSGVIRAMKILDLISDKDAQAGVVPGLERAIPKSKGIEFGSLLHQFGADMTDDPFSAKLHEVFLKIDPKCKDRLPRKPGRKKPPAKDKPEKAAKKAEPQTAKKKTAKAAKDKEAAPKAKKKATSKKKPAATVKPPKKKAAKKKIVTTKKKSTKSSAADKASTARKKPSAKISKRKPR